MEGVSSTQQLGGVLQEAMDRLTIWQLGCYHTPTGFGKTNNPVELFNNAINSLRTLLKLVALAEQLTLMCHHCSKGTVVFALESKSNRELQDRNKYLQNHGQLSVIQPHKHGLNFHFDGSSETYIAYSYHCGSFPRLPTPDQDKQKKKLGKRNKHCMEMSEQPAGGWRVDTEGKYCQCRSWYKYRLCVHLLVAYVQQEGPFQAKSKVCKQKP